MATSQQPSLQLAHKTLSAPLLECILAIFKQDVHDCILVGGTALAGFYASHRRSDDIDLFVKDKPAFDGVVLAVKSLAKLGVEFHKQSKTAQYFHANCTFRKHTFTIDVVIDENIFIVGKWHKIEKKIVVIDLSTLLRMKAATLVSRCAEKDLYDIQWLLEKFDPVTLTELIQLGSSIDAGVSAENLLTSLGGTKLREEACDFAVDRRISKAEIYSQICQFQTHFIRELLKFLKSEPTPPLATWVRIAKKLLK